MHNELKRFASNTSLDLILAVFYEESAPQKFRFSLITTGYDSKTKKYFSNFKRQSFILGQNIPILTAKKQLSWLLNANTKEQITKAFEIEPINKEFYNEIKKAFDKITTQIPTSKIITESKDEQKKDFALKLIGRVLFIRFLKELNFVPNEVFETLFEILKIYHFTIDEQSPSDQEVGLDPELLGQIFENLLAEFNPETKESARKATGSYYTPREIVRYVVCQSLFESFKNHDLVIVSVSVAIENLSPTRHCEQTQ